MDRSSTTAPVGIAGWRERRMLWGAAFGVCAVAIIVIVLTAMFVVPSGRVAQQLRNSVPLGEEYANINRVSDWPSNWIASVCAGPVYPLRNPAKRLPNATAGAACRARINPPGETPNLLLARFPAELPMQIDLHNEGYEWYAFAVFHGEIVTFATFSTASASDTATGLGESVVLQPLKKFGFNIYHDPGL